MTEQTTDRPQTVLIIGAGMAGLSAGCYAQMNGYESHIFELHTIPGGLCTSWRREGYLFDGAVRYLVGTGEGSLAHPMWRELGVFPGREVYYYNEFIAYEGRDGRTVHFYTNPNRLEQHLLSLAPADAEHIRAFTGALRDLSDFDLPVDLSPDDAREGLEFGRIMLGNVVPLVRWLNMTVRDFAKHFHDPLMREAFPGFFQCTPEDFPMLMLLMVLAPMGARMSGYPIGGSLSLAEAVAHRYKALGGHTHYSARVAQVLMDDGRAVGIKLDDGTEYRGDIVISAADGYSTVHQLLGGAYAEGKISKRFEELPTADSIVQVSIGVQRDFSAVPPMLDFPIGTPIDMGGRLHDRLVLKHYCFDPNMAGSGKSALTIWAEADYDFWKSLRADEAKYLAEKERIGREVVAALDKRFPGAAQMVEVIDVATPMTYERYTANWRGSIHGWALGMKKMHAMTRMGMPKTVNGLRDFYMIGQWVEPGGNVELSAASGRDVMETICRKAGKPFVTVTP